jgi:putative spermidine/putrescine transport system substrate-binding protein
MNDSSSNSADSGRRGITRRELLRRSAYGVGGVMAFGSVAGFLEACGSSSSSTSSSAASATPTALPTALGSGGMAALQSAAKAEGRLNTIALPPNWANYGQIISTY